MTTKNPWIVTELVFFGKWNGQLLNMLNISELNKELTAEDSQHNEFECFCDLFVKKTIFLLLMAF